MKRSQQHMPRTLNRNAYLSNLTNEQWALLEPLVPALSPEATYTRREIESVILYVLRSGCPWRMLPHEFSAWGTVYYSFRKWQREGAWDQILCPCRRNLQTSCKIVPGEARVAEGLSLQTRLPARCEGQRIVQRALHKNVCCLVPLPKSSALIARMLCDDGSKLSLPIGI